MVIYSNKFLMLDNLLDINSKVVVQKGKLVLSIKMLSDPSLSDTFEKQIENDFRRLFEIPKEQVLTQLDFEFGQFCEKYQENENFEYFIYWITKVLCTYDICPNYRIESEFKSSKLRYKKKKLESIFALIPKVFVDKYKVSIYSGIVDSIDTTIKYAKQFEKHKFCYRATLIGKEYVDDVIGILGDRQNIGYPRMNNKISKDMYFAKCENIALRLKKFEM